MHEAAGQHQAASLRRRGTMLLRARSPNKRLSSPSFHLSTDPPGTIMTDIFMQFSRRSMPERALKNFTKESSIDIVGSFLLNPDSTNYSRALPTTHEVLALQATEKAKIDVTSGNASELAGCMQSSAAL